MPTNLFVSIFEICRKLSTSKIELLTGADVYGIIYDVYRNKNDLNKLLFLLWYSRYKHL